MMDSKEMEKIAKQAEKEIREKVKASIVENVSSSLGYAVSTKIEETFAEFFEAEIKPELVKELGSIKEELLVGMISELKGIGKTFGEKFQNEITDKISKMSDWDFKEILKKVL